MKLVIVDTLVATDQYRFRWKSVLDGLQREIPEITGTDYITFQRIENEEFSQITGYSDILRRISTILKHIGDDVIFLFTNANNIIAPIIKEYKYFYNKNFKLLGFWNDGAFYQHGNYRYHTVGFDHTWIRDLERTLTKIYDLNLVPPEIPMKSFKIYETLKTKDKIISCNYPFEYALDDLKKRIQPTPVKSNTIILTGRAHTEQSNEMVDIAKRTLKNFECIPLYSEIHTIDEYYRTLSNARGALSLTVSDTSVYSIVECMAMGCVPILPDMPIYRKIFPEKYFYDSKALKPPFLNFIRHGEEFEKLIDTLYKNPHELYDEELCGEIVKKYYSKDQLKEIICNLTK